MSDKRQIRMNIRNAYLAETSATIRTEAERRDKMAGRTWDAICLNELADEIEKEEKYKK